MGVVQTFNYPWSAPAPGQSLTLVKAGAKAVSFAERLARWHLRVRAAVQNSGDNSPLRPRHGHSGGDGGHLGVGAPSEPATDYQRRASTAAPSVGTRPPAAPAPCFAHRASATSAWINLTPTRVAGAPSTATPTTGRAASSAAPSRVYGPERMSVNIAGLTAGTSYSFELLYTAIRCQQPTAQRTGAFVRSTTGAPSPTPPQPTPQATSTPGELPTPAPQPTPAASV